MFNKTSKHRVPRNYIFYLNFIKHFTRHHNVTTLRVHTNQPIKHKPIIRIPSSNYLTVNFLTDTNQTHATTRFKHTRKREPIGLYTLFNHLKIQCQCIIIQTHFGITGYKRIPNKSRRVSLRHYIEHLVCILHIPV
ncbi:hypothetical protein HanPSC8_Chr07g0304621 [Helianthus annuus]|nr:hypothetical protein HanPSC8_Chr07g0304621 [Helianthus annuus]